MRVRTAEISLSWKPNFSYYQKRSEILDEFSDKGMVDAFQWEEASVHARCGEYEEISIWAHGATLKFGSPSVSPERADEWLRPVLNVLQPESLVLRNFAFRLLVPIAETAEKAQQIFAARLFTGLNDDSSAFDAAALVDGRFGAENVVYQTEFGVLRQDEMPNRLTGQAISFIQPMSDDRKRGVDLTSLPTSAWFMRWNWDRKLLVSDQDGAKVIASELEEFDRVSMSMAYEILRDWGLSVLEEKEETS